MQADRRINVKHRGNRLGFWFFHTALRTVGLRGAYGLLYPVCLHYLLFDREAVHGALAYVARRFPNASRPRCWMHVYRLFLSQGRQLIDRFATLSGAVRFEFDLHGSDQQEAIAQTRRGAVLLTAHVGNWQIAMTTLRNMGKRINLVMRPEDNPAVSNALSLSQDTDHLRVISVEEDLGGTIEIMNALRRGEIVSFMGDRPFGFKSLPVQFLNAPARFPRGPFQIAAAANCPVQILLSARQGYRRYSVEFKRLILPNDPNASRRGNIHRHMQEFADILSEFVMKHPYQCFLFTDVWSPSAPAENEAR